MAGKTTIEWTAMPGFAPAVWNPTTGCTRVSAGCDNCYAFALHDKRFKANVDAARSHGFLGPWLLDDGPITTSSRERGDPMPFPKQYDLPFSQVQLLEDRVDAPLRTKKPTCYFVDSMADLFHEDVPDAFLDRVFLTMAKTDRHRFLVLTKRPQRMRTYMEHFYDDVCYEESGCPVSEDHMRHVWLGTSVEDQSAADDRIPHLLATPAAVRFLSCEPLLGPIDIARWLWGNRCPDRQCGDSTWDHNCELGEQRVHWVIAGGESGARARPMDLAWARSLRDQCAAAGVSFFMKQLGSQPVFEMWTRETGVPTGAFTSWPLRESHGRDMAEWPEDLRIRTWPQ